MTMMARNYSAAAAAYLAMASMSFSFGQSLIIGQSHSSMPMRTSFSRRTRNRSSSMNLYIDDIMPITPIDIASLSPALPLSVAVSSLPCAASNIFCATSKLIASDPQLEVEILNDVSHVALDVSTFLSPNTAWLRLFNVIGRALVLSSDCIQHDHIAPDEFFFQVAMLAISTQMFLRSAWPLLLAIFSISSLSVRERRTYTRLFKVIGLTVLQFKTLLSSRTLDWIEYAPNESVELNGEYMHFLYSGDAAITVPSDKTCNNQGTSSVAESIQISSRIFGDVQFAKALEASSREKSKTKKSSKSKEKRMSSMSQDTASSTVAPQDSFIVGSNGASMMSISTTRLMQLMENDDELVSSIQRLVRHCMQEKLSRSQVHQDIGLNSSVPNNSSSSIPNATHTAPANI